MATSSTSGSAQDQPQPLGSARDDARPVDVTRDDAKPEVATRGDGKPMQATRDDARLAEATHDDGKPVNSTRDGARAQGSTRESVKRLDSSPEGPGPLLRAEGLCKSFRMGESEVSVLRDCDFELSAGEFVAIEGRSGSGKSTLLHLLGALDRPASGSIAYRGRDFAGAPDSARAVLRNREFGFVFQFYHLLPEFNVLENTALAALVRDSLPAYLANRSGIRQRARELLEQLGLSHRLRHRPNQLSGGERQRVAIARALMNHPRILFADEPTGNLDADTGRQIMELLERLHQERGQAMVMVTHDRTLARAADRALVLRDGRLHKP